MSRIRLTSIYLLLVVMSGMTVSCAAISQLNLLSTEEEVAIGRQAAVEVEKELKMYDDPVVQAYIEDLGQTLVKYSKRPDLKYYFRVVDTDEVNAFALPGGWLYVNRGLITTAANEAELAGVVGHEVGHVVGKHGARQITKQFGLSVLVQLAVGEDPSLARQIAAQFASLGAGLALMKYSRDAEREADAYAVDMTYKAGINPLGVAWFFEKLMEMQGGSIEGAAVWFSTHPPSDERIANVRKDVQKLSMKPGLRKDSAQFQMIKARLLEAQGKR